jgi:putative hydrolase of the HAD superfamily
VVSNWDVSLLEVLERVGLAPLVDAVVTSAAVGSRKPDPAIFTHALALAGTAAAQARHVGDSLAEDVAGARACGIRPVLLLRDGSDEPGLETIASLAELAWP